MTRNDIIRELVKRTGMPTSTAKKAVENTIDIVADALTKDEAVYLRGFATIKNVNRAAKTARNIGKGTIIHVPPTKQVKFICSKELKNRINNI